MDAQQSSDSGRPNLWTICDKRTEQEEPNEDVASTEGKCERSWTVHHETWHESCEPETKEMYGWKRIKKPSTGEDLLPEVHNATNETAGQDDKVDVLKRNSVNVETKGWRPVNNSFPEGKLPEMCSSIRKIVEQNHLVDHGSIKVEINEDEDASIVEHESEDIKVEMSKSENISAVKQECEDSIGEDENVSDVNDERKDSASEDENISAVKHEMKDSASEYRTTSMDGKKRYHCNKCNETFGSMSTFYHHKISQCGYDCELCNGVFFRRSELRKHMRTTHNYKSFNCDKCNESFGSSSEYSKHRRLQCGFKCEMCDERFLNRTDLVKHRSTHEYKCDVCGKVLKTKDRLKQHRVTHSGERPHACHLCGKTYAYEAGVRYHMSAAHGEMTYKYKCGICGKGNHTISALKQHERTHTGEKPYSCHICGRALASAHSLRGHIMTHTGVKPFKCDICSKSYGDKTTYRYHMRSHTGEKPYQCTVCGKAFASRTGLVGHENVHPETRRDREMPHCDVCGKSFINNWKLKEHMRVHTTERPFICSVCGLTFKSKYTLTCHERNIHAAEGHTDENLHECDDCGKVFAKNSNMERHKVTHMVNKPYQCELCGKSFSATRYLIRHKVTHMPNKPYQCDVCGKGFNTGTQLKYHKAQHTKHTADMPFKCTVCDKGFLLQFVLKQHMMSHTGEKPHQCECGKRYAAKSDLNRHKRRHIGESCTIERKQTDKEKERRFPCTECGKRFVKGCHLKEHMMLHRNERPYKCPNCDQAFVRPSLVKWHLKSCGSRICKICNLVFSSKDVLNEHFARKHSDVLESANNPSSITRKDIEGSETANKEHFTLVEKNKIPEINSQEESNAVGTESNIWENKLQSGLVQGIDEKPNEENCEDSVASGDDDDDVNNFNFDDVNDCDVDGVKKVMESLTWKANEFNFSEQNPFWGGVYGVMVDTPTKTCDIEIQENRNEDGKKGTLPSEGDDTTAVQNNEADNSQGHRFVNGEGKKALITPCNTVTGEYDVKTSSLTSYDRTVLSDNQITRETSEGNEICGSNPLEKLPHIKQEKMDFVDMGLWDKNMFSCKVEIESLKITDIEQAACKIEMETENEMTNIVKEELAINETLVDEITDSTTEEFTDSKQSSPRMKRRKNRKEITKRPRWASCETCGKYLLARNMRVHMRIHSGEKPFTCETCGSSFRRKSDLTEHTKTHNAEKRKQLPCPHCGRNFTKNSNLKKHMLIHTGEKPYQCKDCGERFRQKATLDYHVANRHPGTTAQSEWQCEKCGESFTRISELSRHMQTEHAVKFVDIAGSYPCTICGKAFATKLYLARHERRHTRDTSVLCPVCGEMLAHRHGLKRHLANRHGLGKKDPKRIYEALSCPTCNKLLRGKESLKNHMMITHSEARRFSCKICGNTYKWKRGLNEHMASHTSANKVPCPCNCPECGKLFQTRKAMQRHMRHHDDSYKIKNKRCQICGMTFATKGHLDQHMSKHSNERPFKCTLCHMAYKRKPNLEEHMRTHTGEKNPFPCTMCDKSFVRSCLLQKHMKSHGIIMTNDIMV